MDKVKVLHVHTRLICGGGDEDTLVNVNRLDRSRYEVDLAVGGESEEAMIARVEPHVRVVRIPELVRRISPRHDLIAAARLFRLMMSRRYHIVHTHMAKGGMIGRFAARAAGRCAIVHTIHGQTFHPHLSPTQYGLYLSLERVAGTFTDAFIAVGEELRDWYQHAGVGKPERYRIVHSGVPLDKFRNAAARRDELLPSVRASLGLPQDVPVIGKVARHTEGKGYEFFLDLAERLLKRHPDVHFVALGGGELLEPFKQTVRARGLQDRVVAAGFRRDIAEVVACLDVVVLTSLWEGLPRVLVEASAAKVPIVTFQVGGAREIVHEGESGYVVPLKAVDTMAERVHTLLEHPDLARRMGEAGQRFADTRWSIEAMVSGVQAVYEDVLSRKGLAGRDGC